MMEALPPDPLVSIVVPVFQPHPVFFRAAIQSLIEQSFPDIEVIIVEDPSSMSAREVLAEMHDSRIVHVMNSQRTSLSRQHNRGLSMARGTFLCRFDADDICEPDRVERELAFLRDHPEVDVVGSSLAIIDEHARIVGRRPYPTSHTSILASLRR